MDKNILYYIIGTTNIYMAPYVNSKTNSVFRMVPERRFAGFAEYLFYILSGIKIVDSACVNQYICFLCPKNLSLQ